MSKRAVSYARVSTDEQAEKGYSLPTQFSAMREYATKHSLVVVREIQDDYSEAKLDRPGLDILRGIKTAQLAEVNQQHKRGRQFSRVRKRV